MTDSVLAQLAVLPEKSTAELRELWRHLYDREPPPHNKPFLVKRLAYRIQELAFGGWQGVEHTATVLGDGFEWQGRRYQSLSAIARAITGTRWNGPLFFGVRNHSAK